MRWQAQNREQLVSFLQKRLDPPCSGKQVRKILQSHLCRVNGSIERFASIWLKRGDQIELAPHWARAFRESAQECQTLYEDEYLLAVHKPANWVCSMPQVEKTLGAGLFLVHRLDKDTTGVLLLAKNRSLLPAFKEMFAQRQVEKDYWAIVDGKVSKEEGEIRSFFRPKRTFQGQTIWGSFSSGLEAITCWKRLAVHSECSLLLCRPITGRTHQIRVHLSEMGHPILADRQYANRFSCSLFVQRPLLHAKRIQFMHPILSQHIEVFAPAPEEFFSFSSFLPFFK